MRVIVRLPAVTCPELMAALAPLPPRARAERLRTLATVGLVALRAGAPAASPLAPPAAPADETTAPGPDDADRRQLLARLGASLEQPPEN